MASVVSERYAQALYEAAGGLEQAREAGRALAQVSALIGQNPDYLTLLSSRPSRRPTGSRPSAPPLPAGCPGSSAIFCFS